MDDILSAHLLACTKSENIGIMPKFASFFMQNDTFHLLQAIGIVLYQFLPHAVAEHEN